MRNEVFLMKKMVFAGLTAAALALTVLSSQRAAAQCCPPECQRGGEVSFNLGLTLGCHWTPAHGHWVPNCPPPCCYGYPPCAPYGYPPPRPYGFPPPYGYAPGYPGAPFAAPQPATAAAPNTPAAPNATPATPATPATSSVTPTGLENVSYEYPAAYGYDYGYGYGYPYEQVPGYWYDR